MNKTCLNCKHAEQFKENEWSCEEYYGGMLCHVEPPYDTPCQFYENKDGLLKIIQDFKEATGCNDILIVQKDAMKAWDENGVAYTMQPERMGEWIERESGIEDKEDGFETVIVCSCCDFPATTFYSEDCESRTQIRTDFCPNCGADMRQIKEEKVGGIAIRTNVHLRRKNNGT